MNFTYTCAHNPTDGCHIRNRAFVSDEIFRFCVHQVLVQHAVQPPCLIDISLYTIFDPLGSISVEVICLALHGAETSILEKEPIVDLVGFARAARV